MCRDWGLFDQKHNEYGGIIRCFSSGWRVSSREAVLIYHKYSEVTVGRNSRALYLPSEQPQTREKKQELLKRRFQTRRVKKINNWGWGDFTDTNALLLFSTSALVFINHAHATFRALIDAWISRLFPWIHWDPIHFSVFPNAGLKPKHVQSGVVVLQGQRDQEKEI